MSAPSDEPADGAPIDDLDQAVARVEHELGRLFARIRVGRLQTDKTSVSRQVRQLGQLGLVESIPDPEDGRARVLVATPLAEERVALARSRYEGRIGERLRGWPAADLDHFANLVADLGG